MPLAQTVIAPSSSSARFIESVRVLEPVDAGAVDVERLPDGRTSLVFRVLAGAGRGDVSVAGPRTHAHFKRASGVTRAVVVQLAPGWSSSLLGVPASTLTDRIVPLEDIWGASANDLRRELLATHDLAVVVERLVGALIVRAGQNDEPASALLARRAVRLIEAGETRVEAVADRLGITARHLRRAFTESVGIGPKDFARSIRLQRALRRTTASPDWASIAADAGYYDQAHLIADFRQLIGLTPGAFVRRAAGLAAFPFRDREETRSVYAAASARCASLGFTMLARLVVRPHAASFCFVLALGSAASLVACGGEEADVTETRTPGGGGAQSGKAGAGGNAGTASTKGGAAGQSAGGSGQGGSALGGSGGSGGSGGLGGTGTGGGSTGGGGDSVGQGGSSAGGTSSGSAGAGGGAIDTGGTGGTGTGAAGTSTGTAGTGGTGQGSAGKAGAPNTDAATEVEMTFVTANIGRDYNTKPSAVAAFDKIADFMDGRKGPRFVGWQEIGESDPCGACEWDALTARFKATAGWDDRRPAGKRPDGNNETVKVPVSAKEATGKAPAVRAVYASAGWAGVSPTRFVTVVYYPERNLSFLNTHFIAKAWSCGSEPKKRQDYWQDAWKVLKSEVAEEHGKNRNVIVTGDLNRARATSSCNPDWNPASLHPDARVVAGTGIDYVFAVPAAGHKFVESKDGTIDLTIDSHNAHWVSGRFLDK